MRQENIKIPVAEAGSAHLNVPGQKKVKGMKILPVALMVCSAVALTACAEARDKRKTFDGHYFRTKTKPIDKKVTLANFAIEMRDVAAGRVDSARKAAYYEGVKYCIAYYGTSDIDWAVGPETEELTIAGDTITFQGTCRS